MTPIRFSIGLACAITGIMVTEPGSPLPTFLGLIAMVIVFYVRIKIQIKW